MVLHIYCFWSLPLCGDWCSCSADSADYDYRIFETFILYFNLITSVPQYFFCLFLLPYASFHGSVIHVVLEPWHTGKRREKKSQLSLTYAKTLRQCLSCQTEIYLLNWDQEDMFKVSWNRNFDLLVRQAVFQMQISSVSRKFEGSKRRQKCLNIVQGYYVCTRNGRTHYSGSEFETNYLAQKENSSIFALDTENTTVKFTG